VLLLRLQLDEIARHAIDGPLVLITGEPRARFIAKVSHAVGRSIRPPHRFERVRAGEQQVAFDEMGEAEVGVRLEHFLDFRKCDVELIRLDREQRLDEEELGLDDAGGRCLGARDLLYRLACYCDGGGGGGPERRGKRLRRQTAGDLAGRVQVRSCRMSHLSPLRVITRVFMLVTSSAPDL
jgi:hypothetical protein